MKNLRNIAIARATLNQAIRDFFNKNGFLEVETPILTQTPGMEPHLTPFETKLQLPRHLVDSNISPSEKRPRRRHPIPFYLNHSPELYMKRLLGHKNALDTSDHFDKIFQITKVFRNGEIGGPHHNPEFTMLEWYRKNADYKDLMTDCENLIEFCTDNVRTKSQNENAHARNKYATANLSTQRLHKTDIKLPQSPFPRISTRELFLKHTGIDLLKNRTTAKFKKNSIQKGHDVKNCQNWDDIFFKIFLNEIEPNLPKTPIFITDYPASQAALARLKKNEPFFAERFELYINGVELCNAFSELIDPNEQRKRLIKEQQERKKMGKPVFLIDEEFLKALGRIQNSSKNAEAAGIALGLDRLLMILLNKNHINDVLLFPTEI